MATQRKQDAPNSKEKRGTSPSPSPSPTPPTKTKKSPSTCSTSQAPSSDQKQVPNYLKPTISSSGLIDHHNPPHPKKQGIPSSIKPNINRRRSFDKPPSSLSSSSKLPHANPKSHSPVLTKTNSLPKPLTKKIIQPAAPVATKKADASSSSIGVSSTIKKEKNVKESDQEGAVVVEEEEIKVIEVNNDSELLAADQDHQKLATDEENPSTCDLDDKKECIVEVEGKAPVEEAVVVEKKEEENGKGKELVEGDVEKKEEEDDKEKQEDGNAKDEEVLVENDTRINDGESSEIGEIKVGELEKDDEKQVKRDDETGKESSAAGNGYNDVIEETTNKLLEKRKNKVKALAGAFETVISLQKPAQP